MSRRAALAAALVALAACATADRRSTHGREATGTTAEEVPVRGYPATVLRRAGPALRGELLAIDDQRLWIELEPSDDDEEEGGGVIEPEPVVEVPLYQVRQVDIELHPTAAPGIISWTVVGTLGTLSHGLYLVYSAPAWIGTCFGAMFGAAATDPALAPRSGELAIYARYPQGPPAGWAPGGRPARPRLERSEPPRADTKVRDPSADDTRLGGGPGPGELEPVPPAPPAPPTEAPARAPYAPWPLHPPLDTRGPPP